MKWVNRLFIPVGVISMLTILYTLGAPAMFCFVVGLCVGSLAEKYGIN